MVGGLEAASSESFQFRDQLAFVILSLDHVRLFSSVILSLSKDQFSRLFLRILACKNPLALIGGCEMILVPRKTGEAV
jgi:hypothetical protein